MNSTADEMSGGCSKRKVMLDTIGIPARTQESSFLELQKDGSSPKSLRYIGRKYHVVEGTTTPASIFAATTPFYPFLQPTVSTTTGVDSSIRAKVWPFILGV